MISVDEILRSVVYVFRSVVDVFFFFIRLSNEPSKMGNYFRKKMLSKDVNSKKTSCLKLIFLIEKKKSDNWTLKVHFDNFWRSVQVKWSTKFLARTDFRAKLYSLGNNLCRKGFKMNEWVEWRPFRSLDWIEYKAAFGSPLKNRVEPAFFLVWNLQFYWSYT